MVSADPHHDRHAVMSAMDLYFSTIPTQLELAAAPRGISSTLSLDGSATSSHPLLLSLRGFIDLIQQSAKRSLRSCALADNFSALKLTTGRQL